MADRTIKTRLEVDAKNATDELRKFSKSIGDVGKQSESAAAKSQTSWERLQKSMQTQQAEWRQVGGAIAGVGAAWTGFNAIVAKTGIEYNTLQQTSRAALRTMLGDSEAVNKQMAELDKFARTSPFSKSTFIEAQQQMLAFGIESDKVVGYLSAINDATAAAGGSSQTLGELAFVMAQISAAGKITGQDLIQFGQRGVNAAELIGSQMGKTGAQIRQDITDGVLGADEALDALAAGMSEKFAGASANVKDTMAGAFDRVKAAFRDLSAEIMAGAVSPDGGGWFVDMTNQVADFVRSVDALPGWAKQVGGGLSVLGGSVSLLSGGFLLAAPRIWETGEALKKMGILTPGVTDKLGKLSGVAGTAALTFAGLGILSEVIDHFTAAAAGADEVADALNRTVAGVGNLDDAFKRLDGSQLTYDVDSLSTAMARFADRGWKYMDQLDTINDWMPFEGWASDLTLIENQFGQLDKAMMNLNPEIAAEQFGRIAEEADLVGLSLTDLISLFPEYAGQFKTAAAEAGQAALGSMDLFRLMSGEAATGLHAAGEAWGNYGQYPPQVAKALEAAAEAERKRAGATADATEETRSAIDAAIDYNNLIRGIAGNALSTSAAEMSLIEARQRATEVIKENKANTDLNTEAGRQNRRALDDMASAALQLRDKQMEAGEEISVVNSKMAENREAFIKAAEAAGYTTEEAYDLIKAYGLIPVRVSTEIDADTSKAMAAANALMDRIRNMSTTVEIKANIIRRNFGQVHEAEGGLVDDAARAIGLAGGGSPKWVGQHGRVRGPGTPTSDSVSARIARDEFVTRGDAARYYGYDMLYAMNAKRIPREWFTQLGFAGGGSPAVSYSPSTAPVRSVSPPATPVHVTQIVNADFSGVRAAAEVERALDTLQERAQQRGVRVNG